MGQQFGGVGIHVLYDGLFAGLIVNNSGSIVTLEAHGHGKRSGLSLCGIVSVKVLDLNLILVLLLIVENEHLHGVLEGGRVLEVDQEATLANLILRLLSSLDELGI